MRFGITVNSYYPYKDGVQAVTQNLAEQLVRDGNQVTVITCNHVDKGQNESYNGVKIFRYELRNVNMFFAGDKAGYQKKVLEVAGQVDAMIFVGVQRTSTAWVLPLLPKITCKKYLYVHGIHEFVWRKADSISVKTFMIKALRDVRWYFFYKVNQRYFTYLDGTFQLHNQDAGYIYFEKILPNKNCVLQNCAEDRFFEIFGDEIVKNKKQFISVGNFCFGKNQIQILKALYQMKNEASLIFFGSSENAYYKELVNTKRELDEKFGYREVRFYVGADRTLIAEKMAESNALILASFVEKFPIVILESMAAGTPFISTDVGIVKYLPGGKLVGNDSLCLAKMMDCYIDDTQLYDELSHKAREYALHNNRFQVYMECFYDAIGLTAAKEEKKK